MPTDRRVLREHAEGGADGSSRFDEGLGWCVVPVSASRIGVSTPRLPSTE